MLVPVAYVTIVAVWATTPRMVLWSAESVSPIAALTARTGFAAVIGLPLLWLLKSAFPLHAKALRSYGAGGPGIFGVMSLVYLELPHVDTGVVSLLFGLSPMISGLIAQHVLKEGAVQLSAIG